MSQDGDAPSDAIEGSRPPSTTPEIEMAYSEARARGLPDGWTCSIDVSHEQFAVGNPFVLNPFAYFASFFCYRNATAANGRRRTMVGPVIRYPRRLPYRWNWDFCPRIPSFPPVTPRRSAPPRRPVGHAKSTIPKTAPRMPRKRFCLW